MVHRNGKTKENEEHLILNPDIEALIKLIEGLARHFVTELKSKSWEDFQIGPLPVSENTCGKESFSSSNN
jgi:hypothetical protein